MVGLIQESARRAVQRAEPAACLAEPAACLAEPAERLRAELVEQRAEPLAGARAEPPAEALAAPTRTAARPMGPLTMGVPMMTAASATAASAMVPWATAATGRRKVMVLRDRVRLASPARSPTRAASLPS